VILFSSNDGNNQYIVGKTIIDNGEFCFSGNVDKPGIYYIGYNVPTGPEYALFFLEEGDIVADIGNERNLFYGTANNDSNRECEDSIDKYLERLQEIEEEFYKDSLDASEIATLGMEGYKMQLELARYLRETVADNIDNLFGMYMLVVYNEFFENEEFLSLLQQIPQEVIDRNNNPLYDIAVDFATQKENAVAK
jgi:hypothetical protein